MTIPVPGVERLRALRRMKSFAAGLLVLAAVVFVVCVTVGDGRGAWGYVQAAAEASMVGGLADWFAVTALFRHPLGIPIPHTAIIPRKKDQIGQGLAGFVTEYFLTETVIRERVAAARVPERVGHWLAEPANATQVAAELSRALGGLTGLLRDDELRTAVAGFADRRLREAEAAPLLARAIEAACDSGRHQEVLAAGLRALMRFLDENRGVFRARLADESPEWVPEWVDDRVFARGYSAVQSFLADVVGQDDHELRKAFDRQLRDYATRLRTDPEQAAKVEQAKIDLLEHPQVRDWLGGLWERAKALVTAGAEDPDSELRRSVGALLARGGQVLRDDPAVRGHAEQAMQRLTGHVVSNYAEDLAGVISATVRRWDTAETSRRLELQVGRDLQFIRINGTVVGALAGLVIYTLAQFL